jgi:uncharacterized protein involved in exopolysaccharide biosynthesis
MPISIQPAPPPLLPSGPPEGDEGSAGMSVTQVMCILRAFWKHSLVTTIGVVALGAAAVHMMPKMYVATGTVLIRPGDSTVLNPAEQLPQTFILTQAELIVSASALTPVIDKLDLTHDPQFTKGFTGTPAAVRDVVVASLRDAVLVTPGVGSDLMHISVSYPEPRKAAEIANAITDEYIRQERTRTMGPANSSLALYEAELKELKKKVDEAQKRVSQFRQDHGMIDLEGDTVDTAQLADLGGKLLAALNQQRELETNQVSPEANSQDVIGNEGVPTLRGQLNADQEELATLLKTLGERHPSVVALQARIEATRKALANEVQAISTNRQRSLANARELVRKYQQAVDEQGRKVVERRTVQDQASALLLDLKSAQETYLKAQNGFDAKRYDVPQNGHVSLVERATPPIKATKPNKPKLYILAQMAGLGFGLGWPFAYELLLDRRLRCRDDLERTFRMPVLAQFGPIGAGGA